MLAKNLALLIKEANVSDFLIKEGDPIWCRANGKLVRSKTGEVAHEHIVELVRANQSHSGVHADKLSQLLDATGDVDFAIKVSGKRFRANVYYVNGKRLGMALRMLQDEAPPLETLGLPAVFPRLINQSKGLVLITGATGSGKTTTLASSLEYLNATQPAHIITLEDPVEYVIRSKRCLVDQRQIGRDAKSFTVGLRSALRQDPDVLLVGELRDFDTVKTALDAANTGHLVLGTLHTNSAQQSIDRLTSFFSADKREWAHAVLSQALIGIVSQVLVPRADGTGRLLAAEVMVATKDVRQIIRDGRTHQVFNAMDTGSEKGHVLLNRTLRDMVQKGLITADAALFATYDPVALGKELSRG